MATYARRDPDWIPLAPVLNERSRSLTASADSVWAHIADHESWPEWFTALRKVAVDGERAGIGGGRIVALPGATMRERFTAWEPGRRFAFCVVEGPPILAAMAESVELEPAGDGCTITYRQGLEPRRGFGAAIHRMVLPRLATELGRALDRLAERVDP